MRFQSRAHVTDWDVFAASSALISNSGDLTATVAEGAPNVPAWYGGSIPAGYRYVTIYVLVEAGGGGRDTAIGIDVPKILLAGDSTYLDGVNFTSALKSSTVVSHAITYFNVGAPITTGGIQPTALNLPEFTTEGLQTPREVIERADAPHRWMKKVSTDRQMIYKPKPAAPVFCIGAWSSGDVDELRVGDVRTAIGGEEVHPSRLLMHTGEMIRDMRRIDPDTRELRLGWPHRLGFLRPRAGGGHGGPGYRDLEVRGPCEPLRHV